MKIPPLFDGSTSWFKYEELIDDWLDLTVLEAVKRGPALKNRHVGDAEMHKGLLNRDSLRAEDGVKYFTDTFETPFHQRSSDCFPLEIFINFFGQGEKTMRWSRGSVNSDCSCEASARCLDGLVTNVRHERRGDHPRKDVSIQR